MKSLLLRRSIPVQKGAKTMTVAILFRDELKEYDFGPGHPFRGDRYESFPPFLQSRLSPDRHYRILTAEAATEEDLLRICDLDYIQFNRDYFQAASSGWIGYYENFSRYQSLDNKPIGTPGKLNDAARLIVGQAKMACDLVQGNQYRKVISIGGGMHHAKRRFGEGFCIYNDVAFAALYLIDHYQLNRIMVLDTDAHAGNGSSEYFHDNPKILYIDIHQDPCTIYPGTGFVSDIGIDKGRGFTVNIPLPIHAGNASYMMAFDQVILPLAAEYKPQIIIRNGGSDPHFDDGLTYLGMTVAGFRAMGDKVREMAEVCQGKEIDLIASGYNQTVLPYAWLALLGGIADFPITVEEPVSIPKQFERDLVLAETEKVLGEVKKYHCDYWKCFR
jgi:acetoin utilization protein AcuC